MNYSATCEATFNALTGSSLTQLHHKDKWLKYAQQMAEGQSVRTRTKACDVHRNMAFHWSHRFLALSNVPKTTSLVGIAEADVTFFLESFKGKKQGIDRARCKRGDKALGATAWEIGVAKVYNVQNFNPYDSRLKECMRRFYGIAMHHIVNYRISPSCLPH